jgi:hypothetical protein
VSETRRSAGSRRVGKPAPSLAHVLEGLGFIAGPASEGVGQPSP